jgi:hypothetical protein
MSETITVVSTEHFKSLPEETQKMITALSSDFGKDQMNTFNPLVEAMATMEGFNNLKYVEDDTEAIEQYKGAKKFSGSFNSSTREAKKKLKAPFLATGKKLDAIEKTFLARSKEIMENVNKEFQPYLDAKAEKAAIALAKKNKATSDKIKELSESQINQNIVIQRSKTFTTYTTANQKMLDDVIEKVDNWSEDALKEELSILQEKTINIPQEDTNILLDDQVVNLTKSFNQMHSTCVRMINMRLQEIENNKKIPEAKNDSVPAPPEPFNIPSVEDPQSFGRSFTEIMNTAIGNIELLPTITEKEGQAKTSVIGGLQGYILQILNFIDDGEEN